MPKTRLNTNAPAARPRRSPGEKTFCEFFAGIGLVRAGLESSGWSCVYANDIDPKKQRLYQARFGESAHFHLGDVWGTDEVVSRIFGRPFLATASFPCVDLSLAGHYKGINGEHSSTFFGFVRVLEALGSRRPPLVLLENVTGFLTSRKGQDFMLAVKTLAGLGYWIDSFVLDAKNFVPQSRPRVFIVGVADGLEPLGAVKQSAGDALFDAWGTRLDQSSHARPGKLVRMMQQVELATGWVMMGLPRPPACTNQLAEFVDLDEGQEWWADPEVTRHHDMMSDHHRRQVDGLIADRGLHVGAAFRRVRYGRCRAEVRFDGLAGCLRTPRGGSAKQIIVVADSGRLRMRWMSPREYARLQGAGDFPLDGDTTQLLFGFGDAVCVPVIRWIDQHVLTPIFESAQAGGKNGRSRAVQAPSPRKAR
jgi:DNA (cytosine-5)-methyltransferase 1